MKLLVVEKEGAQEEYLKQFTSYFEKRLYEVDSTSSLIESMNQMYKGLYDAVIVLVFKKPNQELIDFLKVAEERKIVTVVIANSDTLREVCNLSGKLYFSIVTELELVQKNLEEFVKQQSANEDKYYVVNDRLVIDIHNLQVRDASGKEHRLTRSEARILDTLICNKDSVLSRIDILELSGFERLDSKNARSIDVHIKNIRNKIASNNITSIRGVGYKWVDHI